MLLCQMFFHCRCLATQSTPPNLWLSSLLLRTDPSKRRTAYGQATLHCTPENVAKGEAGKWLGQNFEDRLGALWSGMKFPLKIRPVPTSSCRLLMRVHPPDEWVVQSFSCKGGIYSSVCAVWVACIWTLWHVRWNRTDRPWIHQLSNPLASHRFAVSALVLSRVWAGKRQDPHRQLWFSANPPPPVCIVGYRSIPIQLEWSRIKQQVIRCGLRLGFLWIHLRSPSSTRHSIQICHMPHHMKDMFMAGLQFPRSHPFWSGWPARWTWVALWVLRPSLQLPSSTRWSAALHWWTRWFGLWVKLEVVPQAGQNWVKTPIQLIGAGPVLIHHPPFTREPRQDFAFAMCLSVCPCVHSSVHSSTYHSCPLDVSSMICHRRPKALCPS